MQTDFVSVDTLKSFDLPRLPLKSGHDEASLISIDEQSFVLSGIEYRIRDLKPTGLTFLQGIAFLGEPSDAREVRENQTDFTFRYFHGARAAYGSISRRRQPPLTFKHEDGVALVLPDVPMWAFVTADRRRLESDQSFQDRYHVKTTLAIRELRGGEALTTITLQDEPQWAGAQFLNSVREDISVDAAPGMLVATVSNLLFPIPTADFAKLEHPKPLLMTLKQAPVAVSKKESIEWSVTGGVGEYRFELATQVPGITARKGSPIVDIDLAEVARSTSTSIWQAISNGSVQRDAATVLKDYNDRQRLRLTELFGVTFNGVPVATRVELKMLDGENQPASATRFVLLDIPESALKQAMAEHDRRYRMEMDRPGATASTPGMPRVPKESNSVLQMRINELEKENLKLRAQIEVLTQLVRDRNETPSTQKSR
jgi:hypothetical protein